MDNGNAFVNDESENHPSSKKGNPQGMKDSRPITILSILCRLTSKIIADQLLAQLSKILPPGVSGGLPRRGVKDISLLQHYQIERAISKKQELGGFTLDLVKAFITKYLEHHSDFFLTFLGFHPLYQLIGLSHSSI